MYHVFKHTVILPYRIENVHFYFLQGRLCSACLCWKCFCGNLSGPFQSPQRRPHWAIKIQTCTMRTLFLRVNFEGFNTLITFISIFLRDAGQIGPERDFVAPVQKRSKVKMRANGIQQLKNETCPRSPMRCMTFTVLFGKSRTSFSMRVLECAREAGHTKISEMLLSFVAGEGLLEVGAWCQEGGQHLHFTQP